MSRLFLLFSLNSLIRWEFRCFPMSCLGVVSSFEMMLEFPLFSSPRHGDAFFSLLILSCFFFESDPPPHHPRAVPDNNAVISFRISFCPFGRFARDFLIAGVLDYSLESQGPPVLFRFFFSCWSYLPPGVADDSSLSVSPPRSITVRN